MADYLARLAVLIGADSSELQRELAQSVDKTEAAAGRMEKRMQRVSGAISAGMAAAAAALGATITSSINRADKLDELADRLGSSAARLSELTYAAELTGSSMETLGRGLTRLNKQLGDAANGNEKAVELFGDLGINIRDSAGNVRDSQDVFEELANKVAELPEGAQQSALAIKVLGKSGAELVPVLRGGAAGLKEFADEAKRLNVSITDDFADQAAEFKDKLDEVKLASQGLGNAFAEALLPGLTEGADGFKELIVQAKELVKAMPAVALGVIAEVDKIRISGKEQFELLVLSVLEAWERVKRGTVELGEDMKLVFAKAFDFISSNLSSFYGGLSDFAANVGLEELSISLANVAGDLNQAATAEADTKAKVAEANAEFQRQIDVLDQQRQEITKTADAERAAADDAARLSDTTETLAKHTREAGAASDSGAKSTKGLGDETRNASAAVDEYQQHMQDLREALQQLQRSFDPMLALQQDYAQQLGILAELEAREPGRVQEIADARERLNEQYRQGVDEIRRQREAVAESQASFQNDIRLAGLSSDARAQEERAMRAVEEARRAIATAQAAGETFSADEIAGIEATTVALAEQAYQAQRTAEQVEQTAREISDSLGGFAVDAITDFDNIGESWRDVMDSFGDMAKSAVAQVISEFLRLRVIQPLISGLFGGSGGAGGNLLGNLLGGQGGGFGALSGGNILGSLLGSSGAPGGGIGSNFVGPLQPGQVAPGSGLATFGNVLGVAGGLYGVYGAFRSGNPLSGAASGAMAGASLGSIIPGIGNLVGGVVGGIVGALAGIFGGSKAPDLRLGGVGVTRKPEGTFTTELGTFQYGARGIEGAEKDFIKLVAEFDKNIAMVIGQFGNGADQLQEVRAALAKFSVDLKGDAITAERLLGDRFSAILATFDEDVREFVGNTGTVQERAQRLSDAALIVAGVESGFADTFDQLAGILKDNQIEGEALTATYQRVVSSFNLMDSVLDGLGLTTSKTREEFIKFSAGVVQALGGLDAAGSVINRNLSTYLTPEEQRQIRLTAAQSRVDSAGAAAGIAGNLSNSEFKDLLQRALAGEFDEAKTAAILRYGEALADVNDIIAEGADAAATAKPVATVLDPSGFNALAASVRETLADFGRTDYQRSLAQARAAWQATTADILRLAQEGGVEVGATLASTTDAFRLFTMQQNELLQGLRKTVLKQLIDLYGNNAAPVREFVSELDLFQNGMRESSEATEDWATQLARLERLDAATALAKNLRSLFEDGGTGVLEGLAEFKAPIKKILADLGVDFQILTSPASVAAFGRAARLLGLTAEELASVAGIDLSGLTDEQRATINAGAAAKPDAQKGVTDGLAKVTTATEGVEDAVALGLAAVVRELRELRGQFNNKGPAFDPFAAAGITP